MYPITKIFYQNNLQIEVRSHTTIGQYTAPLYLEVSYHIRWVANLFERRYQRKSHWLSDTEKQVLMEHFICSVLYWQFTIGLFRIADEYRLTESWINMVLLNNDSVSKKYPVRYRKQKDVTFQTKIGDIQFNKIKNEWALDAT